jgi:hypothetical protein
MPPKKSQEVKSDSITKVIIKIDENLLSKFPYLHRNFEFTGVEDKINCKTCAHALSKPFHHFRRKDLKIHLNQVEHTSYEIDKDGLKYTCDALRALELQEPIPFPPP